MFSRLVIIFTLSIIVSMCNNFGIIVNSDNENIPVIFEYVIKNFNITDNQKIKYKIYKYANNNLNEIMLQSIEDGGDFIFSYCDFDISQIIREPNKKYPILFCFSINILPKCNMEIINPIPFPKLYEYSKVYSKTRC